jgi:dTDP-4-dehydrorhamnose reductase
MLERARAGEAIRMVSDQRLTPTYTADLAPAVIAAVEADVHGTLHLTNEGSCSWFEFTAAILDEAGIDADLKAVRTVRRPGTADRPLNGVLATEQAGAIGLALRPWREALADYLRLAVAT